MNYAYIFGLGKTLFDACMADAHGLDVESFEERAHHELKTIFRPTAKRLFFVPALPDSRNFSQNYQARYGDKVAYEVYRVSQGVSVWHARAVFLKWQDKFETLEEAIEACQQEHNKHFAEATAVFNGK